MKRINLLILLLSISLLTVLTESCKKDESCPTINCNTGSLNEETCACDCPDGFLGTNCDSLDTSQVQTLLNYGKTPKELFDAGVPLDSLYGKMYEGGIIFYLNTDDGTGMVAATSDLNVDVGFYVEWGCYGTDLTGLNNITSNPPIPENETEQGARIGDGKANTDAILAECTTDDIAAKLCRDLGEDWFLPSRSALRLMYKNLNENGHGGFTNGFYWSSTEYSHANAWGHYFWLTSVSVAAINKDSPRHLRAVRSF